MPKALDDLIEAFATLPGIGKKSAARLAFHLLKRPIEDSIEFSRRIVQARKKLVPCEICGNLAEEKHCEICSNKSRAKTVICVVEESSDAAAIEALNEFTGLYHVLGGALSPLDGIGPDELNIQSLKKRVSDGVSELILATNPTTEGEATASFIQAMFHDKGIKITRIARGIPSGGSLEFTDKTTLARALENRISLE